MNENIRGCEFHAAVRRGYIEAALWTENLDYYFSVDDVKVLERTNEELYLFTRKALDTFDLEDTIWRDGTQFGHDLWLTRNGHGAGFWDRHVGDDEKEDIGDALTELAAELGDAWVEVCLMPNMKFVDADFVRQNDQGEWEGVDPLIHQPVL